MENINHHKNGPQKSGTNGKLGEIGNHRRFDESWDISFLGQKTLKQNHHHHYREGTSKKENNGHETKPKSMA